MSAQAHPKLALRPLLPADVPLLREIFRDSIEELTGDDYTEAQQEAWASAADDEAAFGKKLAGAIDAGRHHGRLAGRLCLARRQGQDRHALRASGGGGAGHRRHADRRAGEARRRPRRGQAHRRCQRHARAASSRSAAMSRSSATPCTVGDEWLANTTLSKQLAAKREALMTKPDTPFPRHWLYYIVLKYAVIAARSRSRSMSVTGCLMELQRHHIILASSRSSSRSRWLRIITCGESDGRERLYLFDTTLRDGAQTNGVDFTLADKLAIAGMLDELGIDYVEGGYPGANPTDTEFFGERPRAQDQIHRLRHDAAAGPLGLERSRPCRAARGQGRRHLLRRQGLGLSRARGAGDDGRRKHRLDPRQRARRQGRRAGKCCSTASISSTATRPIRNTRSPAPRPPMTRARAGSCCATPMAARCRTRWKSIVGEVVQDDPRRPRRHPCP